MIFFRQLLFGVGQMIAGAQLGQFVARRALEHPEHTTLLLTLVWLALVISMAVTRDLDATTLASRATQFARRFQVLVYFFVLEGVLCFFGVLRNGRTSPR